MIIETLTTPQFLIFALITLVIGYGICILMLSLLPKKLASENKVHRGVILNKAESKAKKILKDAKERSANKIELLKEEYELSLENKAQILESENLDLDNQQEYIESREKKTDKRNLDLQNYMKKIIVQEDNFKSVKQNEKELLSNIKQKLSQISDLNMDSTKDKLKENLISERTLEIQKRSKDHIEELTTHSRRMADRMLSRQLNRYEPNFIWPKSNSHIEITKPKISEALSSDSTSILEELTELAGEVQIEFSIDKEHHYPIVKLGGGYGIFKEAARLTLEELLPKPTHTWSKVGQIFQKHKTSLFKIARTLGTRAIVELKLENVHEEIQFMVGALNWRTSYRQNQFHHSLEVAKLAGILAHELGIDPNMAKRCGLLHDIGKGIDFNIEGSHAVISADYADRYGEKKIICDTVMSHHNDLILETPMSYLLKTADTLSGARPGARVNLEEGYQIRLSSIEQAIKSFTGISDFSIMNGGREVHISVNSKKIKEKNLESLVKNITEKIQEEVSYPGQIKIQVSRRYEATAIA